MTSKSRAFIVNGQNIKNMMNKRLKLAKKGEMIKLLERKNEMDKQLDVVLRNQVKNFQMTETDVYKTKVNISKNSSKGNNHTALLRAHHLTNYMYGYLINAFQSGLIGNELFQLGKFQISRIVLPADLKRLSIYWISFRNEDENQIIEGFLPKLSNDIRYLLTSERVLGYIPPIEFKRDDSKAILEDLDDILIKFKRQMGEDESGKVDESEIFENVNVDEENIEVNEDDISIVNNVYGIDRDKLMSELKTDGVPKEVVKSDAEVDFKLNMEKYERSLKAMKLNEKLKKEKMSRSAILQLVLREFEEQKNNL